jgi:membrane protease YdiL (CAAX protease family)
VALTALFFFLLTPAQDSVGPAVQGFIIASVFLCFVPLGYHFLVKKGTREEFALSRRGFLQNKEEALLVGAAFLVVTLIVGVFTPLKTAFALPEAVAGSLIGITVYELFLLPLTLFIYDVFFRGFLQYSWLQSKVGFWAIFIQALLFVLLLLATSNLTITLIPMILAAFLSGLLVWRNGSLVQAWLVSWMYLFLLDVAFLFIR